MRAGVDELGLGAATGEHADAVDPRGEGALDVVDVVADVDRGAVLDEDRALAVAPHLADEVVDVEAERVGVQAGVGRELAGDHQACCPRCDRTAARASWAPGKARGWAGRRAPGRARGTGRRAPSICVGSSVGEVRRAACRSSGGPSRETSRVDVEASTPVSSATASRQAANPGRVSISVMSRSKPTTQGRRSRRDERYRARRVARARRYRGADGRRPRPAPRTLADQLRGWSEAAARPCSSRPARTSPPPPPRTPPSSRPGPAPAPRCSGRSTSSTGSSSRCWTPSSRSAAGPPSTTWSRVVHADPDRARAALTGSAPWAWCGVPTTTCTLVSAVAGPPRHDGQRRSVRRSSSSSSSAGPERVASLLADLGERSSGDRAADVRRVAEAPRRPRPVARLVGECDGPAPGDARPPRARPGPTGVERPGRPPCGSPDAAHARRAAASPAAC